jgi:hypothetical protein
VTYDGYVGVDAEGAWGLQMLYSSDASTISQAVWQSNTKTWTKRESMYGNAGAGVAFFTWDTISVSRGYPSRLQT